MKIPENELNKTPEATIVLLRNTTWKCGRIERLVVNYLRRKQGTSNQPRVNDVLEHFKPRKIQRYQIFEAIWRLQRRFIVEVV